MSEPTIRTLSLGAGRQSTALFILGCEGEVLPKIDAAVFADTQWEPGHVMRHLASLQQFGEEHGVPVYMATKGNLPADVLDRQVFATLPAWTRTTPVALVPVEFGTCPMCAGYDPGSSSTLFGSDTCADCDGTGIVPVRWEKRLQKPTLGRIRRQCTPKYKVEIIDQQVRLLLGAAEWEQDCRYCQATGIRVAPWDPEAGPGPCSVCRGTGQQRRVGEAPAGVVSEQWIGFSADEIERVSDAGFPRYENPRFPLLELRWSVEDCVRFNGERGWQSEKSACIGCPLHDDETWIDMKQNEPEDFADAVQFDRQFRTAPGLQAERFLHESREPLDIAVARAEKRMLRGGSQPSLLGPEVRKKRRGCSPYGCLSDKGDAA